MLVNNFVINTCSFLDSFAEKCDTGLSKLRDRITELEILTVVLEAKLSIIPEVQGEQQNNTSEPPVNRPPPPPPTSTPLVDGTPPPAPPSAPMPATTTPVVVDPSALVVVPISTENPDSSTIAVSKHSTYRKYFKMVSMNIPVEAAKIKMRNDGLDPDLLDTPDLLIPIDGHEE